MSATRYAEAMPASNARPGNSTLEANETDPIAGGVTRIRQLREQIESGAYDHPTVLWEKLDRCLDGLLADITGDAY